uniref:Uncharacterized protein n=1 Tax=Coccidioides posadasii RMSCC 3488 TaxID=454284 RepID=A0A0J6FAP5_COCPO|nr:hypothetical protein CPAG_02355 [Coccidioides posadasii RMSCC 3488]
MRSIFSSTISALYPDEEVSEKENTVNKRAEKLLHPLDRPCRRKGRRTRRTRGNSAGSRDTSATNLWSPNQRETGYIIDGEKGRRPSLLGLTNVLGLEGVKSLHKVAGLPVLFAIPSVSSENTPYTKAQPASSKGPFVVTAVV